MVEHDGHIGQFLKKLDELGIANNTIIMYSTAWTGGEADGRMASKGHTHARLEDADDVP